MRTWHWLVLVLLVACSTVLLALWLRRQRLPPPRVLSGPGHVRRVEAAHIAVRGPQWEEGPRWLVSETVYDATTNTERFTQCDEKGLAKHTSTRKCDAQGRPLAPSGRIPGGSQGALDKPTYSVQGHLTSSCSYDSTGALISRVAFTYDSAGQRRSASVYQHGNRLSQQTFFDASGRLTKDISYAPDGSVRRKTTGAYDPACKLWVQKEYSFDWPPAGMPSVAGGRGVVPVPGKGGRLRSVTTSKYEKPLEGEHASETQSFSPVGGVVSRYRAVNTYGGGELVKTVQGPVNKQNVWEPYLVYYYEDTYYGPGGKRIPRPAANAGALPQPDPRPDQAAKPL